MGVGSSRVSCGQALGSLRSSTAADVVVLARVRAGDLLLELPAVVFCDSCDVCESCEGSARSGFCSTSDLTRRSPAPAPATSDAVCSASLLSERLLRSVEDSRGGASLPAELAMERLVWPWAVLGVVALLLRRNRGRKRRDDLMLLMPASGRGIWGQTALQASVPGDRHQLRECGRERERGYGARARGPVSLLLPLP